MSKAEKILELREVNKSFQELQLFENLNLYLKKGEICCLLGPSGSGKTTLFRIAAGLEKIDSGQIIKKENLRSAYVFQTPRLLPWKTAAENLIFIQKNYGLEKEEKLRNLLFKLSGLEKIKDFYPAQLSGGMKQRLELIRAFAIKANLIFLDEPFKSLDLKTAYNMRHLISLIQRETGLSLFLITHDPEEALLLADRIYILAAENKGIKKEIFIKKKREKRQLNDPEVYQKLKEIRAIFEDLVSEMDYQQEEIKSIFAKT